MTDKQWDRIWDALSWMTLVGCIICLFFWVNNCQRAEIIKACLKHTGDERRMECMK